MRILLLLRRANQFLKQYLVANWIQGSNRLEKKLHGLFLVQCVQETASQGLPRETNLGSGKGNKPPGSTTCSSQVG